MSDSHTPLATDVGRRKSLKCYVQRSGRRKKTKVVDGGSGRQDCTLSGASVFASLNPGPGSFAHIRIWDPEIKSAFPDITLRARWFRRSGECYALSLGMFIMPSALTQDSRINTASVNASTFRHSNTTDILYNQLPLISSSEIEHNTKQTDLCDNGSDQFPVNKGDIRLASDIVQALSARVPNPRHQSRQHDNSTVSRILHMPNVHLNAH
ncbi:hypothetical protein Tco_0889523 [Tanacetum coccineum]